MANAASQILQYRIDSKRIEQDKYQSDLFKRQLDIQDTEAKRQIDVAKSRGDTANASLIEQQLSDMKATPQNTRKQMLQVSLINANANAENNALRQQVGAAQQQNQLYQQQLGFMEFQQKTSSDTEDKWAAAGPEIASAIGEIKKAMMTNQDPNERGALFDRYNALQDQGMQMIAEAKKEALATTKESGQYGKFSANLYSDMRPDVASRARIAERDKEKIDLRVLAAGEYAGGKPGMSKLPFTKKSFIYDKIEALKEGYSEEEWDAAGSLSNDKFTAARDVVKSLTATKTTKGKKGKVITGADGNKYRILDNSDDPEVELVK